VLVDAPCSGDRHPAEHPELKWRLRPEGIAELAALQGRILAAAFELAAPGGAVLYTTCSIEPEENEALLDRLPAGFEAVELPSLLPRGRRPCRRRRAAFASCPASTATDSPCTLCGGRAEGLGTAPRFHFRIRARFRAREARRLRGEGVLRRAIFGDFGTTFLLKGCLRPEIAKGGNLGERLQRIGATRS